MVNFDQKEKILDEYKNLFKIYNNDPYSLLDSLIRLDNESITLFKFSPLQYARSQNKGLKHE